ncbi:MAG: serine/threonine protein kinase [Phycisphaeraceae bacterium]|nr:serine/threonine protein kinase [Phycisphaeraceae bacterium]
MSDDRPTASLGAFPLDPASAVSAGVPVPFVLAAARDPETIGHYRILSRLGEGGFGIVYLAEETEPVRRRVAMKVIKPGMDSEAVIGRFEAERQALAVMNHPCIAKVLGGGATEEGRPYFVMEYVRGVPITEHCDRQTLGVDERIQLFMRVCEAVQHAHQKGVIHRDIKPSNILVEYEGGQVTPKVIDFGVAKALNQRLTERTIFTELGQLIGTPEYMSPEQAEMSEQDIDTRTDVYSLGVVLYELLTGFLPFDSRTLRSAGWRALQEIIREREPPRPSTRLSSVRSGGGPAPGADASPDGTEGGTTGASTGADFLAEIARRRRCEPKSLVRSLRGDLDWVLMKCLEKDRDRRYDTANALRSELERYLRNEPVSAGPPSALYRARKFVRRNRAVVAAMLVVTVALVGATVVSGAFAVAENRQREAAEQARIREVEQREVLSGFKGFLFDDIFVAPNPLRDGADVRVVDLLTRGVESAGERLTGHPALLAEVLGGIGTALVNLGLVSDSIPVLERARELFESTGRRQDRAAVTADMAYAAALVRAGDAREAGRVLDARLREIAAMEPGDERLRLEALLHRANAHKDLGELDDADRIYQSIGNSRLAISDPKWGVILDARYNRALILIERVRLRKDRMEPQEAKRALEEALTLLRDEHAKVRLLFGADHGRTLMVASEEASVLNRLERYAEAEPLYRDVAQSMRRTFGQHHWRYGETVANFGRLLDKWSRLEDDRNQHRLAEAILHYDEALPIYAERGSGQQAAFATIRAWRDAAALRLRAP